MYLSSHPILKRVRLPGNPTNHNLVTIGAISAKDSEASDRVTAQRNRLALVLPSRRVKSW